MSFIYPPQVVHSQASDEVANDDGDQEHHEDHKDLDDDREDLSKTRVLYDLVLRYVTECEVVCKVVFPDHHDQDLEEAGPRVVEHLLVLGQQNKEDHAKGDEGGLVDHEELDQLVDHLDMSKLNLASAQKVTWIDM